MIFYILSFIILSLILVVSYILDLSKTSEELRRKNKIALLIASTFLILGIIEFWRTL